MNVINEEVYDRKYYQQNKICSMISWKFKNKFSSDSLKNLVKITWISSYFNQKIMLNMA